MTRDDWDETADPQGNRALTRQSITLELLFVDREPQTVPCLAAQPAREDICRSCHSCQNRRSWLKICTQEGDD